MKEIRTKGKVSECRKKISRNFPERVPEIFSIAKIFQCDLEIGEARQWDIRDLF